MAAASGGAALQQQLARLLAWERHLPPEDAHAVLTAAHDTPAAYAAWLRDAPLSLSVSVTTVLTETLVDAHHSHADARALLLRAAAAVTSAAASVAGGSDGNRQLTSSDAYHSGLAEASTASDRAGGGSKPAGDSANGVIKKEENEASFPADGAEQPPPDVHACFYSLEHDYAAWQATPLAQRVPARLPPANTLLPASLVPLRRSVRFVQSAEERSQLLRGSMAYVVQTLAAYEPYAAPFRRPVNPDDAPFYSSIVLRPMDLQTLAERVASGVYDTDSSATAATAANTTDTARPTATSAGGAAAEHTASDHARDRAKAASAANSSAPASTTTVTAHSIAGSDPAAATASAAPNDAPSTATSASAAGCEVDAQPPALAEFVRDLQLIFDNCRLYNTAPGNEFVACAQAMEGKARVLLRELPLFVVLPASSAQSTVNVNDVKTEPRSPTAAVGREHHAGAGGASSSYPERARSPLQRRREGRSPESAASLSPPGSPLPSLQRRRVAAWDRISRTHRIQQMARRRFCEDYGLGLEFAGKDSLAMGQYVAKHGPLRLGSAALLPELAPTAASVPAGDDGWLLTDTETETETDTQTERLSHGRKHGLPTLRLSNPVVANVLGLCSIFSTRHAILSREAAGISGASGTSGTGGGSGTTAPTPLAGGASPLPASSTTTSTSASAPSQTQAAVALDRFADEETATSDALEDALQRACHAASLASLRSARKEEESLRTRSVVREKEGQTVLIGEAAREAELAAGPVAESGAHSGALGAFSCSPLETETEPADMDVSEDHTPEPHASDDTAADDDSDMLTPTGNTWTSGARALASEATAALQSNAAEGESSTHLPHAGSRSTAGGRVASAGEASVRMRQAVALLLAHVGYLECDESALETLCSTAEAFCMQTCRAARLLIDAHGTGLPSQFVATAAAARETSARGLEGLKRYWHDGVCGFGRQLAQVEANLLHAELREQDGADLPRERGDLSPSNIALLTGNFGANIGVDLLGFDTLGLEANEAGEKLLVPDELLDSHYPETDFDRTFMDYKRPPPSNCLRRYNPLPPPAQIAMESQVALLRNYVEQHSRAATAAAPHDTPNGHHPGNFTTYP